MKRVETTETIHTSLNVKLEEMLKSLQEVDIYYKFKLSDRLKERNLTMRDLVKFTGLRLATISDLCNGKKQSINLHHLLIIMTALRITDINEIIEIHMPESVKKACEEQRFDWIYKGEIPEPSQIIFNYLNGEYDGLSYAEVSALPEVRQTHSRMLELKNNLKK